MAPNGQWPVVLGLELEEAQRRLRLADAAIKVTPCTSRRGVPGADSARVIRQTQTGDNEILLVVSEFLTSVTDQESLSN